MKMRLIEFRKNDVGAVTIPWILMVAAFIGISGVTLWVFAPGYKTVQDDNLELLCSVARSSEEAMANQDDRVDCNNSFNGLPES